MGTATIISFALGTLLGIAAAWRRGSRFDVVVSVGAIFATSVPAVVTSLIVLFIFGFTLGWFPNGYAADPSLDTAFSLQYLGSVAYHGILPMVTLCTVLIGGFTVTMFPISKSVVAISEASPRATKDV